MHKPHHSTAGPGVSAPSSAPTDAPGKAAEDGLGARAPGTCMGNPDGAPGFVLVQPWPPGPFGE